MRTSPSTAKWATCPDSSTSYRIFPCFGLRPALHTPNRQLLEEFMEEPSEISAESLSIFRRAVSLEIAQTEEVFHQLREDIKAMFNDAQVEISKLVRMSAHEAEIQAYLKGLKFKTGVLNECMGREDGIRTKVAG